MESSVSLASSETQCRRSQSSSRSRRREGSPMAAHMRAAPSTTRGVWGWCSWAPCSGSLHSGRFGSCESSTRNNLYIILTIVKMFICLATNQMVLGAGFGLSLAAHRGRSEHVWRPPHAPSVGLKTTPIRRANARHQLLGPQELASQADGQGGQRSTTPNTYILSTIVKLLNRVKCSPFSPSTPCNCEGNGGLL